MRSYEVQTIRRRGACCGWNELYTQAGNRSGEERGGARSAAALLQDVPLRNAANRSEVKASAGTQRHHNTPPPENSPWMHDCQQLRMRDIQAEPFIFLN